MTEDLLAASGPLEDFDLVQEAIMYIGLSHEQTLLLTVHIPCSPHETSLMQVLPGKLLAGSHSH